MGKFGERVFYRRGRGRRVLRETMVKQRKPDSLPARVDVYLPFTQMFRRAKGFKRLKARTA